MVRRVLRAPVDRRRPRRALDRHPPLRPALCWSERCNAARPWPLSPLEKARRRTSPPRGQEVKRTQESREITSESIGQFGPPQEGVLDLVASIEIAAVPDDSSCCLIV